MATFTSVAGGNWNDGATWGKTSPGVKGTDWPGNAGDVVNIGTTANQSHVVTYNVSETNALGQITIGATSGTGVSRLEFSVSMNTKLTLGHQDILCQLSGELRGGTLGAIIPSAYTAELVWNTTSDNAKGINISAGGKVNLYGDPAYYGSMPYSTLYQNFTTVAQGTTGVNLYVVDNVSAKWVSGQELIVHFGKLYSSTEDYNKAFFLFTLTATPTWDGTKSTLTGTITSYTGTVGTVFNAGGMVVNVSRNVKLYKLGYSNAIGNQNTSRPRVADANTSINFVSSNVQFSGWHKAHDKTATFVQTVIRNGGYGFYPSIGGAFSGAMYSLGTGVFMAQGAIIDVDGLIFNCPNLFSSGTKNIFNGLAYGSQYGMSDTFGTINGSIFSSGLAFTGVYQTLSPSGCLYWNATAIDAEGTLILGSLSYDAAGNQKANTQDIALGGTTYSNQRANGGYRMRNAKVLPAGVTFVSNKRNLPYFTGRLGCEHYKQVTNDHYVADCFGDIYKTPADGAGDNPSQRSGGSVDVCEVTPLSLCSTINYLEILNMRLWAAAGISKTYRFYVQTDFATLPTAELKLYGDYLDQVSGGHLATVSSTQDITTRANAADWSQYVEVTINPTQDGYINLYLRLMGYEAGPKKVWVDPMAVITGGTAVTVTPRWSYGEVELDLDPVGGGVSPIQPGLMPLGVMEVVA